MVHLISHNIINYYVNVSEDKALYNHFCFSHQRRRNGGVMMSFNSEIQCILQSRKITKLYHFTNAENLKNIFNHGLLSREALEQFKVDHSFDYHYNDEDRFEGYKNTVSLSIEFPNYRMFYKYRNKKGNEDVVWAVLELDANLLCELDCVFCISNASNHYVRNTPEEKKLGAKGLKAMFIDYNWWPIRKDLCIDDNYPTNPQAEVLVKDSKTEIKAAVPSKYIKCVWFETEEDKNKYSKFVPFDINIEVKGNLFSPRKDYKHWMNKENYGD